MSRKSITARFRAALIVNAILLALAVWAPGANRPAPRIGVQRALDTAEYIVSNPCLKQSIAIAHAEGELVIWHIHETGGYVDELIRLKANGTVAGNVAMALSTIDIVSQVRQCSDRMAAK